jgi:hypothetical protein
MASELDPEAVPRGRALRQAGDWLAALQNSDGSLGVSASLSNPCWTTPYGLMLWAALKGYGINRARAARWLLGLEGTALPNRAAADRAVGHDTSIVGWPWVAKTHSWLEPTALAVLALRLEGYSDHPRVRDGVHLIRDRAIASGGWNYGNNHVLGHELRPQPAPTGLALLALAGVDGRSESIERAIAYLQAALPETRATLSLCWGVLGLRAWKSCPESAAGWLAEAFEQSLSHRDSKPRPAHLLLAAGARSLELLGFPPGRMSRHAG